VERAPGYFDGWNPPAPVGDADMDRHLGQLYADIALRYARAIRKPEFIGLVMSTIFYKTATGLIRMGDTEQAFLDRLARVAYCGSLD